MPKDIVKDILHEQRGPFAHPIDYLIDVMNDSTVEIPRRDAMAMCAARILGSASTGKGGGVKEERKRAASKAAEKFIVPPPPQPALDREHVQ